MPWLLPPPLPSRERVGVRGLAGASPARRAARLRSGLRPTQRDPVAGGAAPGPTPREGWRRLSLFLPALVRWPEVYPALCGLSRPRVTARGPCRPPPIAAVAATLT